MALNSSKEEILKRSLIGVVGMERETGQESAEVLSIDKFILNSDDAFASRALIRSSNFAESNTATNLPKLRDSILLRRSSKFKASNFRRRSTRFDDSKTLILSSCSARRVLRQTISSKSASLSFVYNKLNRFSTILRLIRKITIPVV